MQKKRENVASLVIAALLVVAIPVYFVFVAPMLKQGGVQVSAASRVVTVDINPSVELTVDADNKVLQAKAMNQDAEKLLATLNLEGLTASEAVQLIVSAAVTLGYIDPASTDTYVAIAVEDNDDESQEDERKLETDLKASAEQGLQHKGAHGKVDVSEMVHERITEAAKLDISAGRLNLIDRLAAALGRTREEVLAQYGDASVKQIMKALNAALGHGPDPSKGPDDKGKGDGDDEDQTSDDESDDESDDDDVVQPAAVTVAPTAAPTQAPKPTATPTPKPTATPTPKPTVGPTVTPDVVGGATK